MIGWGYPVVLAAVAGVVLSLHRQGFAVSKSIAAVTFVFRPGKDGDRVKLTSCTGWVRHTGRFRESRTYEFALERQLSKGDAEVLLLDREKREILRLNRHSPTGRIELDGDCKYYLRWEFRNATGKCALRW